jgi:hypothetical protein
MDKKGIIVLGVILAMLFTGIAAYAMKNKMDTEKAQQIYKQRKELFTLTEEEFMEEIKERNPAEVLFASSMVKKYGKDIEEIYRLVEENDGDFKAVSKLLMDEKDPEMYQKIQQAKEKNEKSLEEVQHNFPVLTDKEKQNLKNEFDKKIKEGRKNSEKGTTLTKQEMESLKAEYDKK